MTDKVGASAFTITTPAATVALDQNRTGEASFTVSNVSGQAIRARVRIVPVEGAPSTWFSVVGDAERDFAAGAAQQFTVRIDPALGAPPGAYTFRADVVGIEHPDDDFTEGPSCTVTVPASTMTLTAPRGYLTTLLGALVGGLLGELIVVVFVLTSSNETSSCSGFECVVGDTIGDVIALLLALIVGYLLMAIGATIGSGIALRIKRYRGATLTATFLAVLMLPWTILMLATIFQLLNSVTLIAVLAPVLLIAAPAVLARASVLLIRTHKL